MKKLLFAVFAIASFLLFSCQKELTPDGFGGGGTSNASGLLTKLIIKSGSDSNVASFSYSASNKLIGVNTTGIDAGTVIDTRERFVRNSQGIITQIITKDADLATQGIDSVVSYIGYSNGRYINRVSVIDFFGVLQFRDSAVFSYDGSGNITAVEDLLDTKSYVEEATRTITYDTKVSPLNLGADGFAMGYYNWYSANNAVKSVTVSASDPSQNETEDVTYVYNSANKPISGTTVIQGGTIANFTFVYN